MESSEECRSAEPATPQEFAFVTPNGAPADRVNLYAREWVPMLEELGVRLRPFYNARHTYITYLLSFGASPLFIARQTGTSLEMIEEHYGGITAVDDELDDLIRERQGNPLFTLSKLDVAGPRRQMAMRSISSSVIWSLVRS